MIVEAMKMENNILSPSDGIVEKTNVQEGDKTNTATCLIKLVPAE
ncbi:biotin/lipoyl-containing protein [Niabella ginsengisoli]|uniref:Lipoyl-binding domain-containing protein n=1 Tax=Niabella ginsengisoli TaxID=522298 RepID=A0ABS9SL65_9BACT|nr:biotin/lipoyl-containing protein [Niabella ginsengisoli]MCH5599050.1 hypothetical protein [Niabella ginsengisoli]